jgi:hypothetical protein
VNRLPDHYPDFIFTPSNETSHRVAALPASRPAPWRLVPRETFRWFPSRVPQTARRAVRLGMTRDARAGPVETTVLAVSSDASSRARRASAREASTTTRTAAASSGGYSRTRRDGARRGAKARGRGGGEEANGEWTRSASVTVNGTRGGRARRRRGRRRKTKARGRRAGVGRRGRRDRWDVRSAIAVMGIASFAMGVWATPSSPFTSWSDLRAALDACVTDDEWCGLHRWERRGHQGVEHLGSHHPEKDI